MISHAWIRRLSTLAVFACLFLARSAFAQVQFGSPNLIYQSAANNRCLWIDWELEAWTNPGEQHFDYYSLANVTTCDTKAVVAEPGAVAITSRFWYTPSLGSTVSECTSSSSNNYYFYGNDPNEPTSAVVMSQSLGGMTEQNFSPGCGPGYYSLELVAYAVIGGSWQGGSISQPWTFYDMPVIPPPQ
jgi:hypothetical protein